MYVITCIKKKKIYIYFQIIERQDFQQLPWKNFRDPESLKISCKCKRFKSILNQFYSNYQSSKI